MVQSATRFPKPTPRIGRNLHQFAVWMPNSARGFPRASPEICVRLWMHEPVEAIARWRIDDDEAIRAVVVDGFQWSDPVGRAQVCVLLQVPARRRRRPGDGGGVGGGAKDRQQRRAGRLYGVKRPETAGERVIAAGHRAVGVVLADGAADLIRATCSCAPTTGDFIPVNRIALGVGAMAEDGSQKTERECCQSGIAALGKAPVIWFVKNNGSLPS